MPSTLWTHGKQYKNNLYNESKFAIEKTSTTTTFWPVPGGQMDNNTRRLDVHCPFKVIFFVYVQAAY